SERPGQVAGGRPRTPRRRLHRSEPGLGAHRDGRARRAAVGHGERHRNATGPRPPGSRKDGHVPPLRRKRLTLVAPDGYEVLRSNLDEAAAIENAARESDRRGGSPLPRRPDLLTTR